MLDAFIARRGIDLDAAAEAATLSDGELARRLVDVDLAGRARPAQPRPDSRAPRAGRQLPRPRRDDVRAQEAARKAGSCQPGARHEPQGEPCSPPAAAEAAARGFAELETTVGVSRYAPLNAIALLVGSQTGRPGVMTQCAVEERRNLQLAMQGLVTYAETLSVYGTERCSSTATTPWSKAFLASAYASRGVKVRFTSGGGSEALMGHAQESPCSTSRHGALPLSARPARKGQNGSISCVALVLAVPGGTREILAENLLAAWLDLEVASGNDAIASHSEVRKTAKLMGQLLPGTDFVTSGYSVMPRKDNMFGGGNYDADDLDEWLTVQRDWQVDAGIEPIAEDEALRVRERGREQCRPCSPPSTSPKCPMPKWTRPRAATRATTCPTATGRPMSLRRTECSTSESGLDVAHALDEAGFEDVAAAIVGMQRQRVCADYLQTSAVIGEDWGVRSAVNDPNEYSARARDT